MTLAEFGLAWHQLVHDQSTLSFILEGGDGYSEMEVLTYAILDELRAANWQRSKNGQKGRNRPKPLNPRAKPRGTRYGRNTRSDADTMKMLKRYGPAPRPSDEQS